MSAPQFTPGPWQVSGVRRTAAPQIGRDTRLLDVGPDGDALALVYFDMQTARGQADARLIAAAPELYATLEHIRELLVAYGPRYIEKAAALADAALAKARGETA